MAQLKPIRNHQKAISLLTAAGNRGRQEVRLGYATYLRIGATGQPTIFHHGNPIVVYTHEGGRCGNAGWHSRTTAERLDEYTPYQWRIRNGSHQFRKHSEEKWKPYCEVLNF